MKAYKRKQDQQGDVPWTLCCIWLNHTQRQKHNISISFWPYFDHFSFYHNTFDSTICIVCSCDSAS